MKERFESEEYKNRRVQLYKDGGKFVDSQSRMTRTEYFNNKSGMQAYKIPKVYS